MSEEKLANSNLPEYIDDPGQVGNKIWRLVPGNGIKITKSTSSSVDTYTFNANVSTEEGNVIEVKDDGLFIPKVSSEVNNLIDEVEDLKEKINLLKETEYRPTESVTFNKDTDESGIQVVTAEVNISRDEYNCIEVKADGLFSRSMDVTPGSIADIERRLSLLEERLLSINQDIDNLKTTAYIDTDGEVTPPIVVPDSENEG
jgi:hypothetical protein